MDERIKQFLDKANELLDRVAWQLPSAPSAVDWSALAYRWQHHSQGGSLQAIPHPHTLRLDDLQDIERQKSLLAKNTRQFLHGLPPNNALLWGSRSGRAAWQFARDWAGSTLLGD